MSEMGFEIKTDLPNDIFFLSYIAWNQKQVYCFCLAPSRRYWIFSEIQQV